MDPNLQRQAFLREISVARAAMANGARAQGWRALELAHVIGQSQLSLHWRVHVSMLGAAMGERDPKEAGAQLLRLGLVPLGHLLNRLPEFNPGRGRIGALAPSVWPPELDPGSLARRTS
jgi:hypothetical protein